MTRLPYIGSLSALVVLMQVASIDCSAQGRVPTLNGHRFIPSNSFADPFVETSVANQLGLGQATDLAFPIFEIDGDTLFAPRGDLLYAILAFQYKQRIKDWLAVRVSFVTYGRLGTDTGSLLSAGITASTGIRFIWLVRAIETDKTVLSAEVGFRNSSTTVVDLFQFVDNVIDGKDARLTDTIPGIQAAGGLNWAYGFSRAFGIKLAATMVYGDSSRRNDVGDEFNWELGLGLSLDAAGIGVPIGALVSYYFETYTILRRDDKTGAHQFELKIDYSQPNDFSLGLAINWIGIPGLYQQEINFVSALFSTRYYF